LICFLGTLITNDFMLKINIQDIDKVTLLSEMWKHQQVAAFFNMYGKQAPVFDSSDNKMREKAIQTIKSGYIDYFFGRAIKMDLSKEEVNPLAYDRDAGYGTFQSIVDRLLRVDGSK